MPRRSTTTKDREKVKGGAAIAEALGITFACFADRRVKGWYDDIIHKSVNGRIWAYLDDLTRRKVEEEHA